MSRYNISVLDGDGIGPEVTEEALKVLRAVQKMHGTFDLEFEHNGASSGQFLKTGKAMTEEQFSQCKSADAMLMGAIGLFEARHPDGREVNGDVIFRLRFDLDLYAGVRPVKLYEGVPGPLRDSGKGIDYVVVRENIEGLYASRTGGCNVRDELATDTIIITKNGTKKIVDYAFRLAAKRQGRPMDGKSIVTCVDKANVLSSYAYFRKIYDEVAGNYPHISKDYAYVDAMAFYQVIQPSQYDVLVAENMFADILSDLSSATIGGLGLAPSGDIGDRHAMFQPAHGSAPGIAGKQIANPVATILSAGMMLDWLGEQHQDNRLIQAGKDIEAAVAEVLKAGAVRTGDIGGTSSTSEVGDAVVQSLIKLYEGAK
ncbi:isocitrate/isopropylmalate dehydrogenase family protein [Niallia taxi]|uniref:isocitrate/isopropylmalate dehydrogenase family protein n=1 Tax=Niallia taxi TaxID=2499688 RepID=UPI00203C302A|nr:isocitrate/isopropylmalate dehydrogenase family protein [Niallia taxi]MCM3213676.1 isocitrate/isopropylmalate dehydrogenase family protein [Niallia taxi]